MADSGHDGARIFEEQARSAGLPTGPGLGTTDDDKYKLNYQKTKDKKGEGRFYFAVGWQCGQVHYDLSALRQRHVGETASNGTGLTTSPTTPNVGGRGGRTPWE